MNGKVVTTYVGTPACASRKKEFFVIAGILIIVAMVLFASYNFSSTGRVSFDVSFLYKEGEKLDGQLRFRIKEGELVPKDSHLVINYGNQSKTIALSELILDAPTTGNYYAEDADISGEGEGYGILGSKIIYPTLTFDMRVYGEGAAGSGGEETSDDGAEILEEDNSAVEESGDSGAVESEDSANADSESASDTSSESSADESSDADSGGSEIAADSGSEDSDAGITGGAISENEHIVHGSVSYGSDFEYNLEEGQTAEIIEGSVKNGEEIPDGSVTLKIKGNKAVVSTEYFVNERGFGEDYLGDYALTLEVDVEDLEIYATPGEIEMELVYDGQTIAAHKENVAVSAQKKTNAAEMTNATFAESVSSLEFFGEIPVVRIQPSGSAMIDLSEYFKGAESYTFSVKNISADFSGSEMTLSADEGFKGARIGKVTAVNGSESLESNEFTILVSSGAVSITTERDRIVVGQKVKWTKDISLEDTEPITVEIPAIAEDVNVKKIVDGNEEIIGSSPTLTGSVLSGDVVIELDLNKKGSLWAWLKSLVGSITGKAVEEINPDESMEIVLEENASDYVIEYYTEAPTATEQETSAGKIVTISGPDEVEYTDVIAFVELNNSVSVEAQGKIKVYWHNYEQEENVIVKKVGEVGETDIVEDANLISGRAVDAGADGSKNYVKQSVPFDAYDLDGDDFIDYVEWVVPHLSNQTYEIVIEISSAEHLDSDRVFVSDIYDKVAARDGIWAEIPDGHYVRATFRQNLTSERDITIYAKSDGSAEIEVYETGGNETIAVFENVGEDKMYKIYLTSLVGEQDTFDLLVKNAAVEFDYIVDPEDTTAPDVSFSGDTPADLSSQSADSIYVGLDSSDDNGGHYAFANFDKELVLWMRMDDVDGSGNPTDLSSNSYNGTKYNNADLSAAGHFGNGVLFDGDDDYIRINGLTLSDVAKAQGTISFWIYWDSSTPPTDSDAILTSDLSGFGDSFYLLFRYPRNSTNFGFDTNAVNNDCSRLTTSNSITPDAWTHVTYTWNSSSCTAYINGAYDSNDAMTGTTGVNLTNEYLVFGAKNINPLQNDLLGTIDEVMIFNRSLTPSEISSLYDASVTQYSYNFTELSEAAHTFTGYAVDLAGNKNETELRTVTISSADTTLPDINVTYPINGTSFTVGSVGINYTVSDVNLQACWWTNNSGLSNNSVTCGANITGQVWAEGTRTVIVYANDSFGNTNSSFATFIVDLDATVEECNNLTQANTVYTLMNNVSTTGTCFFVTANNVTLDLNGYSVTGDALIEDSVVSDAGVAINGFNTTTVRNGKIYDFVFGVNSTNGYNGTFNNLTIKSVGFGGLVDIMDIYGIYLGGGGINAVNDCNISNSAHQSIDGGSPQGVYLFSSSNNVVSGNTINSLSSEEMAGKAIVLYSSDSNVIENNIINSIQHSGFFIYSSNSNVLTNNSIDLINVLSIYLGAGSDNYVSGGSISNSGQSAIYVLNSDANNTFSNISISGTAGGYYDVKVDGSNETIFEDIHIGNYSFVGLGSKIAVRNSGFGEIRFLSLVNGSGTNLSNDIRIGNNSVVVESGVNSGLNRSANITLYGTPGEGFEPPVILRNGVACPSGICYNFTSLAAETVVFNVSYWTNYSIGVSAGQVNDCANFSSAGVYTLQNSISATGDCFRITSDDVTIDFNGYSVTGDASGVGINATGINNFTIENMSVSGFAEDVIAYISNGSFVDSDYAAAYDFGVEGNLLTFENSSFGKIEFLSAVNGSGTNLSSVIRIGNNSAFVNITSNVGLNKTANITLRGLPIGLTKPIIYSYDADRKDECSTVECVNSTSLTAGTVVFRVTHWSDYSVEEWDASPSQCGNLVTENGVYTLQNSVSTTENCFLIRANNITLDCVSWSNRIIYGDRNSALSYIGIYSANSNVTIKDCEVTKGSNALASQVRQGISLGPSAQSNLITNVNSSSNTHGFYTEGSNNFFRNITANSNNGFSGGAWSVSAGILVVSGSGNVFDNVTLSSNTRGAFLQSSNNNFTNVNSNLNGVGIYINFGSNNSFNNWTINGSFEDALYIIGGGGPQSTTNNLFENVIVTNTNNSRYDLRIDSQGAQALGTYLIDTHLANYSFVSTDETGHITLYIKDSGEGEIKFFGDLESWPVLTLSGVYGINLSNDVRIDDNLVVVDSGSNPGWNISAEVSLYGTPGDGFIQPVILRNGVACGGLCDNFTSLTADTVVFNVSYWTNYSIGEGLGSCLGDNCTEGGDCNVTLDCALSSDLCENSLCQFNNLKVGAAIYTLFDDAGNARSLDINLSGNISFLSGNKIDFSGRNGSVGGNASVLNITVPWLFNTTSAVLIGRGGFYSLRGTSGGDGGVAQLNYWGLISKFNDLERERGDDNTPILTAGSSVDEVSGDDGQIVYNRDLTKTPRDADVNDDGEIDSIDDFIIHNNYNKLLGESGFSTAYDINADNNLNVIDISKIGFEYESR